MNRQPGEAVLELESITAGYGGTKVLRDVTLTVPRGCVVALLGANGAGKTTLLRVAAGLITPSEGRVMIASEDVTGRGPDKRARAGLCLVPEGRGIFRSLTVRENLILQVPPWSKNAALDHAYEAFPILWERRNQVAGTLSGGQQQMLALARGYLANPSVVLLDEVSIGLAPRIVEEIFESLVKLAEQGAALLLVEQYVQQALSMADFVYILKRGKVAFSGCPGELDADAVTREYLGADVAVTPVTDSTDTVTI
jgi:branched-chain amino acid transport system ATP-binding protein